jgi:hypothetical protein
VSGHRGEDDVARALEDLREQRRRRGAADDARWRATVEQRLAGLEDSIGDLRVRVNSVLALLAAAIAGQVILRLLGH